MLKGIINELLERVVSEEQIIYIPLDKRGYKAILLPLNSEFSSEKLFILQGYCITIDNALL